MRKNSLDGLVFSYYRKDFSVEFDRISLGDIQDVSFYLIKIDFIIIRFSRILKDDSLIK